MTTGSIPHAARFDRASDQALLVSFGTAIGREAHGRVCGLLAMLQQAPVPGVLNLHPAYCSLLIRFDLRATTHAQVEAAVRERIATADNRPSTEPRRVTVPVCYGGEFGPDLAALAQQRGLSVDEAIGLHSQIAYTVYFLGFAPGFAYLGTVPDAIAAPRLATPRTRVEPGSVGIAGRQTGVYPCAVPGGWRIVGRTPLRMFQPDREPMSLLLPGDEVRFCPVDMREFVRIERGEG